MKEYIVKKIADYLLTGKAEEMHSVWDMANENADFTYPWEQEKAPEMIFRALHDNQNFYFRFDVEERNILTFTDKNHKMEVVDSDRVEIFFRQNDKMNPYYCLEMDAHARVLDYEAKHYRDFDFDWEWEKGKLSVEAFKHANGYVVEGSIELSSLKNMGLLRNNIMEAGLFRGQCLALPKDGKEADMKWISWVKPESNQPDFHIPSSFGLLKLEV